MRQKIYEKINILCVLICIFVIIFDQATKMSIMAFIPETHIVPIFKYLNIVLTFNFGTSFGLLSPNSEFGFYFIIILSIGCIIFLGYMFFYLRSISEKIYCSMIIGGAIGNLIDRFIHGAVVDFIDVYYQDWHWPAFNIADSFISCGTILLIVYNLFSSNKRSLN